MRLLLVIAAFSGCGPRAKLANDPTLRLHRDRDYAYCRDSLSRLGIDVDAENQAALSAAQSIAGKHAMMFDTLIVPGYTSFDLAEPTPTLHPFAKERLLRAVIDYEHGLAPFILLSGGNVYPSGTPYNEALQMKRFLVDGGFPAERILVEPCARHSTTNLRNSGRLMLAAGMPRGLIVTSFDQAYYFMHDIASTFRSRQMNELGHTVGNLKAWDPHRVGFVPTGDNFRLGTDELDP